MSFDESSQIESRPAVRNAHVRRGDLFSVDQQSADSEFPLLTRDLSREVACNY